MLFVVPEPPTVDNRIEWVARTVLALRTLPIKELMDSFDPGERLASDYLILEHIDKAIELATAKLATGV